MALRGSPGHPRGSVQVVEPVRALAAAVLVCQQVRVHLRRDRDERWPRRRLTAARSQPSASSAEACAWQLPTGTPVAIQVLHPLGLDPYGSVMASVEPRVKGMTGFS